MKLPRLLTLLAIASVPAAVSAQTVLSDFSDIAAQVSESSFSTFLSSWSSPNQFVQNTGSISIAPQSGGNPQGDGTLLIRMDLDLTAHTSIDIAAREDSGNANTVFSVVFYSPDPGTPDSQGASAGYTFTASDFAPVGSEFTTLSIDLSDGPDFTTDGLEPFDPSNVNYWEIEGDPVGGGSSDFRMSFDSLQLTPVPEPATWAMLLLGGGLLAWRRSRKR